MGVIAAAITFMFLNLDSLYRPVANCSLVPIEVSEQGQNRQFMAAAGEAKAVTQITDRFITQREA